MYSLYNLLCIQVSFLYTLAIFLKNTIHFSMAKSFQRWRGASPSSSLFFPAASRVNIPAEVDARENCVFLRASRCLFTRRGTAATARYLATASRTPSFFLITLHPTPPSTSPIPTYPPGPHRRSFTDSPGASNNVASQPFHPWLNHLSLFPPRHLHRRPPRHRMSGCGRRPGRRGWWRAAPYLPPTKWASLSRPSPTSPAHAIQPPTTLQPCRWSSEKTIRATS